MLLSCTREAYEFQPQNCGELLSVRGICPETICGFTPVSETIYGKPSSWTDPVKFSFAYGGKDGVLRPVGIKALDKLIQNDEIDDKTKYKSLKN